jgi:carbamoylphosphate synthase large subunit
VDRREFHEAMKKLGLDVPKKAVDDLFSEWDKDGGGSLGLGELKKILSTARRTAVVEVGKEEPPKKTVESMGKAVAATKRMKGVASALGAGRETITRPGSGGQGAAPPSKLNVAVPPK